MKSLPTRVRIMFLMYSVDRCRLPWMMMSLTMTRPGMAWADDVACGDVPVAGSGGWSIVAGAWPGGGVAEVGGGSWAMPATTNTSAARTARGSACLAAPRADELL